MNIAQLVALIVLLSFVIGMFLGVLIGKVDKKGTDGTLYMGINKDGTTWMGMKATDPRSLFFKEKAVFDIEIRDDYNPYSDENKEEKSHGSR